MSPMFASKTIVEHLARGLFGLLALATAVVVAADRPGLALTLVTVGLLSMRGCPLCWTIGLVQTAVQRLRGAAAPDACIDGRCALRHSRGRAGRGNHSAR